MVRCYFLVFQWKVWNESFVELFVFIEYGCYVFCYFCVGEGLNWVFGKDLWVLVIFLMEN